MPITPLHAAIHEAGHAVAMWYVGWGDNIDRIQMQVADGQSKLANMKFSHRHAPRSLSDIRSTLLVLFAGAAAASKFFGREMNDIGGDWHEAKIAVALHFAPKTISGRLDNKIGFLDPAADHLVQDAILHANRMVGLAPINLAVNSVADLLVTSLAVNGTTASVLGTEVLATCERVSGEAIRANNPYATWINGES